MDFAELLIRFRKRAGLNKTDLSKRLSVSLSYIQHIEGGRANPPSIEKCHEIAKILSLTDSEKKTLIDAAIMKRAKPELLDYINQKVDSQEIPLIDWVLANRIQEVEDPLPQGLSYETVIITNKGGSMLLALKVNTDCMEPEFVDGDVIVIDPSVNPANGNYVVVQDNELNEAILRQLKRKGPSVFLLAINPPHQIEFNNKRHKILGKVIKKLKDY